MMMKIDKQIADSINDNFDKAIEEMDVYSHEPQTIDSCKKYRQYILGHHDVTNGLVDMINNSLKQTNRIAVKFCSTDYKDDFEKNFKYYVELQVKGDNPFVDVTSKKAILNYYQDLKAELMELNSNILFKTITLSNVKRLLEINNWDNDDKEK